MEAIKFSVYYIFLLILISCNKSNDEVELVVVNNNLVTYSNQFNRLKDTLNIIKYKIENKTKNNYFFYLIDDNISAVYFDNYTKNLRVFEEKTNNEVKYSQIWINNIYDSCAICKREETKKIRANQSLNKMSQEYFGPNKNNYFFLKSGESKYFESIVKIQAKKPILDNESITYAIIDNKKSYYAKLYMKSKNINLNILSWSLNKTIKENNYKIYSNQLVSKNQIPIKIIDK